VRAPTIGASCQLDKEVEVITRKLVVAGISALALTPGVAWACNGMGGGPPGSPGAVGATGATGATAATGTSGVTNASVRQSKLRHAHHAHAHRSTRRG
jgi:hypothetical protein